MPHWTGITLRAIPASELCWLAIIKHINGAGNHENIDPQSIFGLLRSAGGWSALKAIRNSRMRIMGDERILGGNDFVESVLEKANEEYEKRTIATAKGFSLEKSLISWRDILIWIPTY